MSGQNERQRLLSVKPNGVKAAVDEGSEALVILLQAVDNDLREGSSTGRRTTKETRVVSRRAVAERSGQTHSALTSAREYLTSTATAIASVLVGQRASVSSVRSNEATSLALIGQTMMIA